VGAPHPFTTGRRGAPARQQGSVARRAPRLTLIQVAWLAGLLEGEGYFGLIPNKVKGKTYRYARVGVTMTDEDVIRRAAS
jgi:hypothetical protein